MTAPKGGYRMPDDPLAELQRLQTEEGSQPVATHISANEDAPMLTPEDAHALTNEYSHIRANINPNTGIIEDESTRTPEGASADAPKPANNRRREHPKARTSDDAGEAANMSAREAKVQKKMSQFESGDVIVTTLRIPKKADHYIEDFLLRWNRIYAKPRERRLKQDVIAEALAAWIVDHPLPKDTEEED
jgi:hypothetical protein